MEFTVQIDNPCPDHILFARFPVTLKNPVEYSNTGFEETERTGERKDFAPELKSTQSLLKPMRGYAGLRGKKENASQGTAAEPVSYTHLDVYKRQVYLRCIRNVCQ